MAMSFTWNENTPADTDLISGGDDIIRELKKAIRERLDVEHIFTTGNEADVGKHNAGFITEANGYLGDASVVTAKIKDGNVTSAKLATDAVETVKIKDANVTTPKIADGAVTTPKIPDSGVTTPKIADGAVTLIKIATAARGPGSTLDADTVDGKHASDLALASQGVTNGDQHDHSGGDGAQIAHSNLLGVGSNSHAVVDAHLALTGGVHSQFVEATPTLLVDLANVAAGGYNSVDITSSRPGSVVAKVAVLCVSLRARMVAGTGTIFLSVGVRKSGGTIDAGGGHVANPTTVIAADTLTTVLVPLDGNEAFEYSIKAVANATSPDNYVKIYLMGILT